MVVGWCGGAGGDGVHSSRDGNDNEGYCVVMTVVITVMTVMMTERMVKLAVIMVDSDDGGGG